jgi:hypothetical protein
MQDLYQDKHEGSSQSGWPAVWALENGFLTPLLMRRQEIRRVGRPWENRLYHLASVEFSAL